MRDGLGEQYPWQAPAAARGDYLEPNMASDGKKLLLRNVARWDEDVDACVAVLGSFSYEVDVRELEPGDYLVSVVYTYPDTDWPNRAVGCQHASASALI